MGLREDHDKVLEELGVPRAEWPNWFVPLDLADPEDGNDDPASTDFDAGYDEGYAAGLADAGVVAKAFSEDQPRDDHGMWTAGSAADVEHEYKIEYTHHTPPGNPFPTLGHFQQAVASAKPMVVTPEIDKTIAYRSKTKSFDELHNLVKGYASYPKFRNEGTLRALSARIEAGHPTNMPLVIRYPGDKLRVLSGNTRMDLAFQHGKNPSVLVLDATKKAAGIAKQDGLRTLYVRRDLLNVNELATWARDQGLTLQTNPHVTVAYSTKPLIWPAPVGGEVRAVGGVVQTLDGGAVVLSFYSSELGRRWEQLLGLGASWGYDQYNPHVTITYEPGNVDPSKVEPYRGPLVFGPEIFEGVSE